MNCAICESSLDGVSALGKFGDQPERYYRCPKCLSLVLAPLPTGKRINAFFEELEGAQSLIASERNRKDYFDKRLSLVADGLCGALSPRLLEIGCGSGVLLKMASERGWSVEACELSPALAQYTHDKVPEAIIHQRDFLECDTIQPQSFDAIVALDIIEHVLSPQRMLEIAKSLLVPGGLLLLQTPNALSLRARIGKERWNMLIPEYHFHLFTVRSLLGLLRDTGFTPVSVTTVSGSGEEQGIRRWTAAAKEKLLSVFRLGNALLVLARS